MRAIMDGSAWLTSVFDLQTGTLHHVYRQDGLRGGVNHALVAIELFAWMNVSRYHVVTGERYVWMVAYFGGGPSDGR
jgi:hypothetical protein